jgi:glutaminyl-tRNA synthetase
MTGHQNVRVNSPILRDLKLVNYILQRQNQLDGGMKYLRGVGAEPLDGVALEEASGVGVVVTREDIAAEVAIAVEGVSERLKEERYRMNTSPLLGKVIKALKWADPKLVKAELDLQVEGLLGPRTEEDNKKPEKKKAPKVVKAEKAEKAAAQVTSKAETQAVEEEAWKSVDPFAFFPKPEDNNQVHTTVYMSDGRQMQIANSTAELQKHLAVTKKKVITRFPPEPNGYLHIGHAKAMFIDFGMAEQYGGECCLRFDDTNPEAEKQEYIDHIQDIVAWLGWTPGKITFSSDYFHELHALAVKLIETGNAYVCHQTGDEIKASREKREPSPWRDRPKEESLKLFEDMRKGLVDEGKATLRMRQDHKNENYNMFDLIAYRIKFVPHPRAGDQWCIYPSYDFTHCLVDSLENITHSLCTLEFESRRASYYWLLHVLDLYKPVVWEYSRLNISHTVLSKRKLNKLVTDKYVSGWDDPRLMTLAGLRRRGVTPESINLFCRELGITRNDSEISPHKFEYHVRMDLDATSERALAVLSPLKVVIDNLPDDHVEQVQARVFPGRTEETYPVPFSKVVYIESTDFRTEDAKGYYGLAPGKSVMLRYAYPITCTSFRTDDDGNVVELHAECDRDFMAAGRKPPKGVLNWVGQSSKDTLPAPFEARLYGTLFKSDAVDDEDGDAGGDWLEQLNPENLVVSKGFCTEKVAKAPVGTRLQLERLGFFVVDPDTTNSPMPVLNRTVTLRETVSAKAIVGNKK